MSYRHMEDFVTWVDTSKLKRTVMRYNDEVRAPDALLRLFVPSFVRVLIGFCCSSTTSTCCDVLPTSAERRKGVKLARTDFLGPTTGQDRL